MNAKDVILGSFDMGERIAKAYLTDLSAADLLVRATSGQNHMAWQLGHLILVERNFVDGIKPGSSPALPENFEEGHGRQQTNVDDPSKYYSPEEYLRLFDAQRQVTKKVLNELSDAELEAPGPENVRKMAPTNGAALLLAANHHLMHVGQFVSVRRLLGKPIAM